MGQDITNLEQLLDRISEAGADAADADEDRISLDDILDIALAMPFMEVVPFSANGAGAALTAFGLALIMRDGILALVALVVTAGTFGVVLYNLL